MENRIWAWCRLLASLLLLKNVVCSEHTCQNNGVNLTAADTPQILKSPIFPDKYPHGIACLADLVTEVPHHVLHVEVVHMDLSDWNNTCGDRLVAKDAVSGNVLQTWCGSNTESLITNLSRLHLEFTTDLHVAKSGFVLRFWAQEKVRTNCLPGGILKIPVGSHPVYITIPEIIHDDSTHLCRYSLLANDNQTLDIRVDKWRPTTFLHCGHGELRIYDGNDTRSPLVVSWCHRDQPFASLTSSGRRLTIETWTDKLINDSNMVDTFTFRITTRPKYADCDAQRPSVLEVTPGPSAFTWLPSHVTTGEQPCPLKVVSTDSQKTIRLDVMNSRSGVPINCLTDYLNASEGSPSGDEIEMTCHEFRRPVYRSRGPSLYINESQGNESLLLRLSALDLSCNGGITNVTAWSDRISSDITMKESMCPNNVNCTYRLTAQPGHSNDVVHLELKGNLYANRTASNCTRDYIVFYDGWISRTTEIGRWCPGSNDTHTVISTQRHLYFSFITDDGSNHGYFTARYFSTKRESACKEITDLRAPKDDKEVLKWPNHGHYTLNNDCHWRIFAARLNYVVIINLTATNLPHDCSDILYITDGLSKKMTGRVCGNDSAEYRSTGPWFVLHFTSDASVNMAGFSLTYRSEHTSGARRTKDYPPVGIIAGACIAITVTSSIIYVIVHISRKEHKLRKQAEESIV